jgi:hypothetical protein
MGGYKYAKYRINLSYTYDANTTSAMPASGPLGKHLHMTEGDGEGAGTLRKTLGSEGPTSCPVTEVSLKKRKLNNSRNTDTQSVNIKTNIFLPPLDEWCSTHLLSLHPGALDSSQKSMATLGRT